MDSVATQQRRTIALIGNPNTGKSTLFNALTGLHQKVGNYPGVTVERHMGALQLAGEMVDVLDLPGTYSLAAHSPDEMITVDSLVGALPGQRGPDLLVVILDAGNLRRNLFLLSQSFALGLPIVVALNMMDRAASKGVVIDVGKLSAELGVPVVPMVAARRRGLDELEAALQRALEAPAPAYPEDPLPELREAVQALAAQAASQDDALPPYLFERALIDVGGYAEQRLIARLGAAWQTRLAKVRERLGEGQPLVALEARARYAWAGEVLDRSTEMREAGTSWSDRIDRVLNHPVVGSLLFLLVMAIVFQSVFAWATPVMDLIDLGIGSLGAAIGAALPEGALASLLVDGVIAGVGSVVIFLPQIIILFAFIIFLEDTGYMARAAFLVDRFMRACGLSGQSFIPMLSSFACAVPGIMSTRVIPDRRDRIATIMAAPFMTCSARLPVYALLIAAFVPRQQVLGVFNVQGLVLLGLYLLGIVGGITTALLLKRSVLRGPPPPFMMELPPYHLPNLRAVLLRLWERVRIFLTRAGTIIFTVAVIVWGMAYFPRSDIIEQHYQALQSEAKSELAGEDLQRRLQDLENQEASELLEQSLLGRMGKTVEPLFMPLGWDWRVSAAVIASLPAREVVIAVLGTIYSVGADVDAEDMRLAERIKFARWDDGRLVFNLSIAIGLMIFYALCLQCVATLAVIKRETNSYAWPIAGWVYMTALGYLGALTAVQIG